jgi:hypothetical protein
MFVAADVSEKHKILSTSSRSEVTSREIEGLGDLKGKG